MAPVSRATVCFCGAEVGRVSGGGGSLTSGSGWEAGLGGSFTWGLWVPLNGGSGWGASTVSCSRVASVGCTLPMACTMATEHCVTTAVTPGPWPGVETLVAESAAGSSEPGTAGGWGPLRGSFRLPWPGSAGYDLLFSLLKRRHLSPLAPCHFLRRYDVTPPLTASVTPCPNASITYFLNAFCIEITLK